GYVWDAPDASYFPISSDYDWSANSNKVAASWNGFSGANITGYEVGLSDNDSGTDNVCSFRNVGVATEYEFNSINCSGINLENTKTYYTTVRAYTNKPNYYYPKTSNGITIDTEGPTVSIFPPSDGQHLNKTFDIAADADDGLGIGVEKVEFQINNLSLTECYDADGNIYPCPHPFYADYDGSDGYTASYNSLNIPDNTTYNLKVTATDKLGNPNDADITIYIDNTPPANPALSVYATSTQAELSWNSDPEVVSYNLFKEGSLLVENLISISYIDKDVIPGETYHYRVTAKDDLGNESSGSEINVTIPRPGVIIASSASRLGAALGEINTPLPEKEAEEENEGEILGTTVAKSPDQKEEKEKTGNYTGWIYLLLLYILIILGYYYYYLKDEYTAWFWVFPAIVGLILLFINNSLIKVLSANNLAKLFWLWELIIFIIFCVYYQFFGRPLNEKEIAKKFKIPTKK
ncbi:MAG: Ig-like domain-containing protein, partial [Promethearchaeota archaeon]